MGWFGEACVGCGSRLALGETRGFCDGCAPAAERAGKWLPVGDTPVAAGWAYAGPLQVWIHRSKQGTFADPAPLLPPLDALLRELAAGGPVRLVAIPPQRRRLQARGLHVPDLLVDRLRRATTRRAWLLERVDEAPVRRDHQRQAPVFRATVAPPSAPVVLIDDVVTTGQTLQAAVAALRTAGQTVRGAICLADARPQVLAAILGGGGRWEDGGLTG